MLRFLLSASIALAILLTGASTAFASTHHSPLLVTHSAYIPALPQSPVVARSCTYVVQTGDYLSKIAPSNWRAVAAANHIANPNLIYPGQVLNLCVSSASVDVQYTTSIASPSSAKGPNTYPWGWCTWGAEELATRDLNGLGDASSWTWRAAARGIPTGYVARPGATAVFAPGYHVSNWGTSSGHVAHVNAVSGGMMQITEMNNSYYGGFGRWDTVWIAVVSGVSFIY